jgi:transcription elongation GreA/GreB family factor
MKNRYLTYEEAGLVEQAAEQWLRLRDVEFNAGEEAAALIARCQLREPGCTRRDIATLDSRILLKVQGHPSPVPLTLVRPEDEALLEGRVSLLGELGLPLIGQVVGSRITLPQGVARFVGFDHAEVSS